MKLKRLLPIIGIIILLYIISTLNFGRIKEIFIDINPLYLFLAFFSFIPIVLMSNIQWRVLLKKQRIKVSFWYSLKNIFIGYFYGAITPGGFGAYTRAIYLSDESKSPLPKCLSNIVIHNTIDYISLLLLGAAGAFYFSSRYSYLLYIIIIVIIIIIALMFFFLKKEKSKKIFTKIVKSRIFETVRYRIENSIDSFYEDLPRFKDVLKPFSISFLGWVVRFIEFYLISKLFMTDVPLLDFVLIISVSNVVASIPITIYGLGTREATLISLFSLYGIDREIVVTFSLFWFVVIWLTPSIIGSVVTIIETRRNDKINAQMV